MKKLRKLWILAFALLALPLLLPRGDIQATSDQFTGWVVTFDGTDYRLYNDGFRSDDEPMGNILEGHNTFFDVTYIGTSDFAFVSILLHGDRENDGAGMEGVLAEWWHPNLATGESLRVNFWHTHAAETSGTFFTFRGSNISWGGTNFRIFPAIQDFTGWVITLDGIDYRLYNDGFRSPEGATGNIFVAQNRFFYVTYLGASDSAFAWILLHGDRENDGAGMEGVLADWWHSNLSSGDSFRVDFWHTHASQTIGTQFSFRATDIEGWGEWFRIRPIVQVNLIADPALHLAGTEVTMNNGARGSFRITQGFTRILYIGVHGAFESRHNFTLTSSNPNVATISEHGTIFARSTGTTLITVVSLDNTRVGQALITVVADNSHQQRILGLTTDTRPGGDQGTEVTSGLGSPGGRTIHIGMTRHMSFTGQVPSPLIQDYIWVSSDPSIATVSQFGTVTAVRPGTVTITSVFRYNQRFSGSIVIVVLP